MKPRSRSPRNPTEWLRRARSNLALARSRSEASLFEDLCFEAQQACEKAIKAVLVHRSLAFPRIHDIAVLLTMLQKEGVELPALVQRAGEVSRYAVETRYPGAYDEITEAHWTRAVEIADATCRWAESVTANPPG